MRTTTDEPAVTNFSTRVNGRDLRATIIRQLVDSGVEHLGGDDPATFTDNLMVKLGFDSGYDGYGDYVLGYREYMVAVGLIGETVDAPERWSDDTIQFPRLLAELRAVGLTARQWSDLLDSMDLETDDLTELFERAEYKWEQVKDRTQ